jgi:hypothetical protein
MNDHQEFQDVEHSVPLYADKYLRGMNYPANKADLIQYATSNGADKEFMVFINRLLDREYYDAYDVNKAIGQLE